MTDVDGFDALTHVYGDIQLSNNALVTSLPAFNNVEEVASIVRRAMLASCCNPFCVRC